MSFPDPIFRRPKRNQTPNLKLLEHCRMLQLKDLCA
jgi:hypothetical protein